MLAAMSLAGRYELVRLIGAGGMAQVFEAVAVGANGFRRTVAIKRIVPEHIDDEAMRRMFLDEARIASYLHHSNITQVLDYGTVDGGQFLVLEHVDGPDAGRAARLGREMDHLMPIPVALYIIAQVAHALHYAHERHDGNRPLHIVHRDVSPGNILLSNDGDVKLTDFGIALADAREERTRTGVVKGKLHYMPPEQLLGHKLTGAADVYALGGTLYAFLSGRAPSKRNPTTDEELDLPPEVRAILERCMDHDPEQRPTAAGLAVEAERAVAALGAINGRSALCKWLALLQPRLDRVAKRADAFDRIMGACLVPTAAGHHEFSVTQPSPAQTQALWRTANEEPASTTESAQTAERAQDPQTAERTSETRAEVARTPSSADEAGHRDMEVVPAAPRHVRLLGLLAAVAVLLLGGGALVWARATGAAGEQAAIAQAAQAPPGTPPSTARAAARAPTTPTPAHTAPPADRVLPTAITGPASVSPAVSSPPPRAHPHPSHTPRTHSHGATHADQSPDAPAPAAPTVTGWVRIGGETLSRSPVEIDGARRGFAPLELTLPAGPHHVRVVNTQSGVVLLDRMVTVTETNRRAAPLRIIE